MRALAGSTEGKLVTLDGKTMRHSFDKATGTPALHAVNAWVAENRLVLGQLAVDDHSNEIPALPTLIGMLDLNGAVVTVGAMGCQVAVAKAVLVAGADYVMTCKGNQPTRHEELAVFFEDAGRLPFAFVPHTDDEVEEGARPLGAPARLVCGRRRPFFRPPPLARAAFDCDDRTRADRGRRDERLARVRADEPRDRRQEARGFGARPLGHRESSALGARHCVLRR